MHTHSLGRTSEREVVGIRERDYYCREIIFMFLGFTFGADSIYEEVAGFSPLWFPRGFNLGFSPFGGKIARFPLLHHI